MEHCGSEAEREESDLQSEVTLLGKSLGRPLSDINCPTLVLIVQQV